MKIPKMKITFLFVFMSLFISCNNRVKRLDQNKSKEIKTSMSFGERIISNSLLAHGGEKFEHAQFSFIFRNKEYLFKNNNTKYYYQVASKKDKVSIIDILDNDGFIRKENGKELNLNMEDQKRFGNSLNSVIYFATLPHKLKDQAVNKKHLGSKTIKGKEYEVVQVTFDEIGGGDDHDDIFYYWINKETDLIDFLAYNYQVNNGGVRFREAYNLRRIDGITFQDYVNYKAEVGTALANLPDLWESNKLKELSRIEIENIKKL